MAKKLLLVICYLSLALFLSGCVPQGQKVSVSTPSGLLTRSCYFLEEGVTVQVDPASLKTTDCRAQLDSKTYVRIRQNVRIINGKIGEGKWKHPTGDCASSAFGSLREVGKTTDGRRVFWESENHNGEDLKDFILVFLKEEKGYHYFDVYYDQAKKDNIPDFVKNCQESGGLIPVVEPPNASFPPQSFEKAKIDKTGYEVNFSKYEPELKDYYIKVQEKERLPEAAEQIGRYTLTLEGQTKIYDVFFHAGVAYLEEGSNKPWLYNPSDTPPPFVAKKRDPSLQLGTLQFITTSEWTWATPECKPVIYLYPEKPIKLNIKLNPAGKLTLADPPYDPKTGWEVIAQPNGNLEIRHSPSAIRNYPYLHYEALIEKFQIPPTGWVIKKEDLEGFFKEILPKVGLNEKEAKDFEEYWLEKLNDSPYFLVSLLPLSEIERIEPLELSTKPQTSIRVRFYFKALEKPVLISPPQLPQVPERKGFTLVEWGGLYKKIQNSKFKIQN